MPTRRLSILIVMTACFGGCDGGSSAYEKRVAERESAAAATEAILIAREILCAGCERVVAAREASVEHRRNLADVREGFLEARENDVAADRLTVIRLCRIAGIASGREGVERWDSRGERLSPEEVPSSNEIMVGIGVSEWDFDPSRTRDGWGNTFVWIRNFSSRIIAVRSIGSDGINGTPDDIDVEVRMPE